MEHVTDGIVLVPRPPVTGDSLGMRLNGGEGIRPSMEL